MKVAVLSLLLLAVVADSVFADDKLSELDRKKIIDLIGQLGKRQSVSGRAAAEGSGGAGEQTNQCAASLLRKSRPITVKQLNAFMGRVRAASRYAAKEVESALSATINVNEKTPAATLLRMVETFAARSSGAPARLVKILSKGLEGTGGLGGIGGNLGGIGGNLGGIGGNLGGIGGNLGGIGGNLGGIGGNLGGIGGGDIEGGNEGDLSALEEELKCQTLSIRWLAFLAYAQSANLTKAQMVTYLTNATVQQEFVNSLLDDFKCIRDELAKVIQDLINASPFNATDSPRDVAIKLFKYLFDAARLARDYQKLLCIAQRIGSLFKSITPAGGLGGSTGLGNLLGNDGQRLLRLAEKVLHL